MPPRNAARILPVGVASALLLWVVVLLLQWRHPTLPALESTAAATLIVLTLGFLLLRQSRREVVLAEALQQEIARRKTAESGLRQARNMAAIGRLTRGLAHDFNNHLTVVNSNIEMLARRLPPDSEPLPRLADAAIQGVRRAALLTHRLLSLSRKQGVEPEPVDLGRLVGGMAELLRRALGEAVSVETVLADGLWLAWADASQVEWALLDLALNASEAMPEGGVLRIETANVQGGGEAGPRIPGEWVMLAVSDTRTAAPDSRRDGTAEFVGGALVEVGGQPNQGSCVRLYLPRHVVTPVARDHAGTTPARGAGTILLVEDDNQVRDAAARALREIGYEVLEASDAMEGFRLIADRGGIDLLFTDIGLPGGVDGRALADAARNLRPELGVLFTTGYASAAPSAGGENATLFLAKPFSLDALAAKVSEAMAARNAPVLAVSQV